MRHLPALALWLWAGAAYAVVGNISAGVVDISTLTQRPDGSAVITGQPCQYTSIDADGNVTCYY